MAITRRVNEITNDLKYESDFIKMFGVPSNFDQRWKGFDVRRGRVILGSFSMESYREMLNEQQIIHN
ncbi:MAG: hypothetical protein KAS04_06255 [Candidatus Aenigmarchaeota archaeon]|nr:hypothetical protein [Candidatus Aenigmarchaeota archaeon]